MECRNSQILQRYGETFIKVNYLSYKFKGLCLGHKDKPKYNNWTRVRNHNFFPLCLFLFGVTGKIEFVNKWEKWFERYDEISVQKPKPIIKEPEESPQLLLDFIPGTKTKLVPATPIRSKNFFKPYKGLYNAFFIEDDDGSGTLSYGVSNIIIEPDDYKFFWQSEVHWELYYSRLKLLVDDSTARTFFVRELNNDWGYMMMFPKTPELDDSGGFILKYFGIKETNKDKDFTGKAYFMPIRNEAELILPTRRKDLSDVESLLLGGNPENVFRISEKLNDSQPALVTYQQLLKKAESLQTDTVERIEVIIRELRKRGAPNE